jgi:NDP-4-keto-2,6-dideoxyhexose 3-C-methyltransferase
MVESSKPWPTPRMDCYEATGCRLCGGSLTEVLDLGTQILAGQFPAQGDPPPPAFPLELVRCTSCTLVQLMHTVNPELLYRNYWYRSGVTATMRSHLQGFADEAIALLGKVPASVLDIGANDNFLLNHVARLYGSSCVGIDPSDVRPDSDAVERIIGFYPHWATLKVAKFDLVFTVACFYDTDDPVAFARAVRENLTEDGLWCVEVADCHKMMTSGAYDAICHEHLTYWTPVTLMRLLALAGLRVVTFSANDCNGGTIRLYARRGETNPRLPEYEKLAGNALLCEHFCEKVKVHKNTLRRYLKDCLDEGVAVHLLGASTKMNTVLQYCGVTRDWIECASERDERKWGRRTPGSDIPIVSEEQSRATAPDVYLVGPWHFKDEICRREEVFLGGGGKLVFPLPEFEEVSRE